MQIKCKYDIIAICLKAVRKVGPQNVVITCNERFGQSRIIVDLGIFKGKNNYFFLGQCKRSIDIAFAVDASGSIGIQNFNQIKEFLYTVVREHDVGQDFAHFALIHFSNNASVSFDFNTLQGSALTAANVNNLIRDVPYQAGETSIYLALIMADRAIFSAAGGWRPDQSLPKVSATSSK